MSGEQSEGWRGEIGGAVILCVVIFFADASSSSTIPTFPFYATSLGASITMIGALASASGLIWMLSSVPLGLLSDRIGRRRIMLLGMLCFVVGPLIYSLSTDPLHLLPARVILGVAMASTFSIGFVYISEAAPEMRRGLIQGLYMTSMGVGFTVGPLLGGLTAKAWGYESSFYTSSGLALVGLALLFLVPVPETPGISRNDPESVLSGFRRVLANPRIAAAGAANFFNSLIFSAIMVYFPLFGRSIGLDEPQVGLGLTVRGLVSTVSRFPTGTIALRIGALKLMALGLVVSAAALFALPSFEGLVVISAILGVQGAAYGVYLTSGNMYVTEEAPPEQRGTAMGVYSTFSNVSGVLSPLILGAASEAWGFRGAFWASSTLALGGTAVVLALSRKGRESPG